MRVIRLSSREVMYLRNTTFLPTSLSRFVDEAFPDGHGHYEVSLSPDSAEEFRSILTERLAKVGFDANHELKSEGRILEELIDRFQG